MSLTPPPTAEQAKRTAELAQKIEEASAAFDALSPLDKAAHRMEQKRSYVRGESDGKHVDALDEYVVLQGLRSAQAEIEKWKEIAADTCERGDRNAELMREAEEDAQKFLDRAEKAEAEIERLRARPSTSQAIEAVEEIKKQFAAIGTVSGANKRDAANQILLELRKLPADPFNPLSYAAGARRAVDLAKRLMGPDRSMAMKNLESIVETELAGSAGERKATEELAEAAWQILDDMGADGHAACGHAKALLRKALQPFWQADWPDPYPLAKALKVIVECDESHGKPSPLRSQLEAALSTDAR